MKRAVSRLVEVLEISLGRVRLAHESVRVHSGPLPLGQFLAGLLHDAAEFWPDRLIRGDFDADSVIRVNGDEALLRTALLNLLDNSVKYSCPGSEVAIALDREGAELLICVSNQGSGIAPDERDQLFDKYFRGRSSMNTAGTGVGLYLVARIVEEHGGRVTIDNGPAGVVATVRLPVLEQGVAHDEH